MQGRVTAGALKVQIQQEIAKLMDGAYLPTIYSKITEVKSEFQQIGSKWGPQTSAAGYGDGAHVWKMRTASCPDGQYVTGINVSYRGTCQHQCDSDGGIIGNIELVCRSLK